MSEVEMEIATADKVIEIADAETRLVDMDSIQNHPENPRWHSRSQIEELAASLDDHDYASISLTVSSRTGNIVKGNGMYNALQLRQCQKVRVVWKDMTPLEELQFLIRDNRLSELSRWDLSVLNANLATLNDEGFELEDMSFELEAINELEELDARRQADNRVVVEDDPPEVDEGEPVTQYGDLWLLGKHRVLCSDSTKQEDVERVMGGEKADMVFTDPPYGVKRDKGFEGFEGFGGFGTPIARRQYNDEWDSDRPTKEHFDLILSLADNILIFGGNYFADILPRATHWLVWDKLNTMPTFGDCELIWTNSDRKSVKKITFEYNGLIGKEEERFHPTQKPVGVLVAVMEAYESQLVCDPFLGSGTTLIAADQLDRICYGLEISEKYCDVIVKRYINHVGSAEDVLVERNGKTLTWEQAQKVDKVKVA